MEYIDRTKCNDIAVVGIACRLPGADNYREFWKNLITGRSSITEIPKKRWDVDKYYSPDINDPNKTVCKWEGLIEEIDKFDPDFFNISPQEARNMDPQQRLLLQEMWHCLEDAGIPLDQLQKKTSVYIGMMTNDYNQVASSPGILIDRHTGLGNYSCILANRISFFFNFTGASMAIDAACASSLVAVDVAKESLIKGSCNYAITAGVNLNCHPWKYISFSKSGMLSSDGICKTFDKDANGYVPGEGIAVIILQRLIDAIEEGNHIYGVIKGTAVNHSGKTNSITAPRVEAQQEVILEAYKDAAITPSSTTYIEAHGTGTSLGDPIEIEALTRAFRDYIPYELNITDFENNILNKLENTKDREFINSIYRQDKRNRTYHLDIDCEQHILNKLRSILIQIRFIKRDESPFCSIGSVKTNIGHSEAAAGIIGIIKVLLMFRYKQIPPTLNVKKLNPVINFNKTPFKIARKKEEWHSREVNLPRRAGVSSFGFGGVNSHAVLEEYSDHQPIRGNRSENNHIFALSSNSKTSMEKLIQRWKEFTLTDEFNALDLFNSCATLLLGRSHLSYRYGFITNSKEDLINNLDSIKKVHPCGPEKIYYLGIGRYEWVIDTKIEKFMTQNNTFKHFINDFKTNLLHKPAPHVYSFIINYCYIKTIMEYGFEPDMIFGEGEGVLMGLVMSGIVKVKDAIKIFSGTKKISDIQFFRPEIPYYDAASCKTIMPFYFDAAYLKMLISDMKGKSKLLGQIVVDGILYRQRKDIRDPCPEASHLGAILQRSGNLTKENLEKSLEEQKRSGKKLGTILVAGGYCDKDTLNYALHQQDLLRYYVDDVLKKYVDKARLLNSSQHTFRRYLDDWNLNLKEFGRDLGSLLNDNNLLIQDDGVLRNEKLLLMVIIISSLRKLNRKWDLTEQLLVEEERFYELINLVVDGIMPMGAVVELFTTEEPDLEKIATSLNHRQKMQQYKNAKKYIHKINPSIPEIHDKTKWFKNAVKSTASFTGNGIASHSKKSIKFVLFGEFNKREAPGESINIIPGKADLNPGFRENILKLWLYGIEIHWNKIYPEPYFKKVSLPIYPFDRKAFWLTKADKPCDNGNNYPEESTSQKEKIHRSLNKILADILGVTEQEVKLKNDIRKWGIDSMGLAEFSDDINKELQISLDATIFYEYPTIQSLTEYIMETYNHCMNPEKRKNISSAQPVISYVPEKAKVAIVGIAGRFPGADDPEELWKILIEGKDMISEIPADRWDWREHSGSKWGGFLNEIKHFDASFFNISPREAELMDPQQRLLLQEVRHAFEDAGQNPSELSGTNTGMFIGVTNYDYNELMIKHNILDSLVTTGVDPSIIPNRISYLLNIHGPSECINAACASSLIAIHRAVQSIKNGESEMAVAGGVNLICSTGRYTSLSKAGLLSADGHCKTFDISANGYVRSEGIGVLFLKPLKKALEDKNPVYGIIKGTAENHGGYAASLTAPNPNAQSDLIKTAVKTSGIDPSTITFIETHGTGTALGDPIEIKGLKMAFKELYGEWRKDVFDKQICGLGAMKTKIGHTEAASGVVSVIKILLAIKHGILPRVLNLKEQNSTIKLENSPFYIIRKNKKWEHMKDENGAPIPRRGAAGSFGFGGANSYIVIEEYMKPIRKYKKEKKGGLILFSAKSKKDLRAYSKKLHFHLETHKDISIQEIAYTLQRGRENFCNRAAIIADDIDELKKKLLDFYNNKNEPEEVFSGFCTGNKNSIDWLLEDRAGRQYLDTIIREKQFQKLAIIWVEGTDIDWRKLYPDETPNLISLPGYPFNGKTYWLNIANRKKRSCIGNNNMLHPLIDENVSTLYQEKFKKTFYGSESYLCSHIISGNKVLPGVVYIEMARAAGELALHKTVTGFRDIQWKNPIIVDKLPVKTDIVIYPLNQEIVFRILRKDGLCFCSGTLSLDEADEEFINPDQIKTNTTNKIEHDQIYKLFEKFHFYYKAGFRSLRVVHYNPGEALGEIKFPGTKGDNFEDYILHPALLDSAFQTTLGLYHDKFSGNNRQLIPISIESLFFSGRKIPENCLSYVLLNNDESSKKNGHLSFDIKIADNNGKVFGAIKNFKIKESHFNQNEKSIDIIQKTQNFIKNLLSKQTKYPLDQINVSDNFEKYGINSIMILNLNEQLAKDFPEISKTLFFEYKSIRELTDYFLKNHKVQLKKKFLWAGEMLTIPETKTGYRIGDYSIKPVNEKKKNREDIAIIGIGGKFPGADTLDEFWMNLKENKNCITEIPPERWDYKKYFNESKNSKGTMYSKWGGFINDIDKFDPMFFNISPGEANLLDPQIRLFLENAWHTFEDAGYSRTKLKNSRTGIFAGLMFCDYNLFEGGTEQPLVDHASVANRVSYFFDLSGPSITTDTLCSSSLTIMHYACLSIHNNDCEMALAGGVNITVHPKKYLRLCQQNFLSSDGLCRSFGEGGDGYVPGEGVGAVLLKPLKSAMEDGDYIYAVIKGTAVNHGGKTNGYTVPNPIKQAEVIKTVFQRSGINPRTVSYIEAHGTGTTLGDPIEIAGLTGAYSHYTTDKQFCSIGSLKSNIGHLEGAAGIAGLIKVLLQMKHKKLISTIHAGTLNKNINFKKTPFYVQRCESDWERPVVKIGGKNREFPRRAAVSAFGAGGANAHIIVEEYIPTNSQTFKKRNSGEYIIVLSAKKLKNLKIYCQNMLDYILLKKKERILENSFIDKFAYTLQTGREPLNVRLSFIARSIEDIIDNFRKYSSGKKEFNETSPGRSFSKKNIDKFMENHDFGPLAEAWTQGINIDWERLYSGNPGKISGLPCYPFEKKRCWITGENFEDINIYYYKDKWIRTKSSSPGKQSKKRKIIVFSINGGLIKELKRYYEGQEIYDNYILVIPGENLLEITNNEWQINIKKPEDYNALFDKLIKRKVIPDVIIYTLQGERFLQDNSSINNQLGKSFYSLIFIARALMNNKLQKIKLLYLYNTNSLITNPIYASNPGFFKTLHKENPQLLFKQIQFDNKSKMEYGKKVAGEMEAEDRENEIYYKNNIRYIKKSKEISPDDFKTKNIPFKSGKTYIITGGSTGLGYIIAEYLVQKYNVNLILTGRSPLSNKKREIVNKLKHYNAGVMYLQSDASKYEDVKLAVKTAKSKFNSIDGIIHSAGITRDAYIFKKTLDDIKNVLLPKVHGTVNLDEATKNEKLDFFVLFSSTTASIGNPGQADYAYGNNFLNKFTRFREKLRVQNKRNGITIAINWPLWKEGGMQISEVYRKLLAKNTGMIPLKTKAGINAFENAFKSGLNKITIVTGNKEKIDLSMNVVKPVEKETRLSYADITKDLIGTVSSFLKVDTADIDEVTDFTEYGFDSISYTLLAEMLNNKYKSKLTPDFFNKHNNIKKTAALLYGGNPAKSIEYNGVENNKKEKLITMAVKSDEYYKNIYKNGLGKFYSMMDVFNINLTNSISLEVFTIGEGTPILLLCGNFCLVPTWIRQIEALYDKFKLIIIHYPGVGGSGHSDDVITFKNISNLFIEVMDKIDIISFHLIGWSFGGSMAIHMAYKYPNRIKTLCLVNTSSTGFLKNTPHEILNQLQTEIDAAIALMDEKQRKAVKESFNGELNWKIRSMYLRLLEKDNTTKNLNKIKIPTLIISGKHDKIFPENNSETIHLKIEGSKYFSLSGAKHLIPLSDKHYPIFNNKVVEFINVNSELNRNEIMKNGRR